LPPSADAPLPAESTASTIVKRGPVFDPAKYGLFSRTERLFKKNHRTTAILEVHRRLGGDYRSFVHLLRSLPLCTVGRDAFLSTQLAQSGWLDPKLVSPANTATLNYLFLHGNLTPVSSTCSA